MHGIRPRDLRRTKPTSPRSVLRPTEIYRPGTLLSSMSPLQPTTRPKSPLAMTVSPVDHVRWKMCFLGSKLRRSNADRFAEGPCEVRLRREAGSQGDFPNLTAFAEQAHLRQSEALMTDELVRRRSRGESEAACEVGSAHTGDRRHPGDAEFSIEVAADTLQIHSRGSRCRRSRQPARLRQGASAGQPSLASRAKAGGPGRTRTCNQTVMSGRL
jgi:hypothetical protein